VSENQRQVVRMATGQYFTFGSGDDFWDPAFVSTLVGALASKPQAVCAVCNVDQIDTDGEVLQTLRFIGDNGVETGSRRELALALLLKRGTAESGRKRNLFIHGVFRTSVIQDCILGLGYERTSERDTLCRAALHGPFVHVDQVLFRKTVHGQSFKARNPEDEYSVGKSTRGSLRYVGRVFHGLLLAGSLPASSRPQAFWIAYRMLRRQYAGGLVAAMARLARLVVPTPWLPTLRSALGSRRLGDGQAGRGAQVDEITAVPTDEEES